MPDPAAAAFASPDPAFDPRLKAPPGAARRFQVTAGVAAIREVPAPDGRLATQALCGEAVDVFGERGGFARVRLVRDGYTGWTDMEALSFPFLEPSLKVSVLRTYVFSEPDLKSAPRFMACLGARFAPSGADDNGFVPCARTGWVWRGHLAPLGRTLLDPAGVALSFSGTPYLWGGRESLGLDCTGLTQQAFEACGVLLPRDSDQQMVWSGEPVEDWDAPDVLRRGDLLFWKGHVAIALGDGRMVHSNAHHMAVAAEPIAEGVERIASLYARPIGARRVKAGADASVTGPDWREAAGLRGPA